MCESKEKEKKIILKVATADKDLEVNGDDKRVG